MSHSGAWTPDEDVYLVAHYATKSAAEIAMDLGRTVGSVRVARSRLGLRKRVSARDFPIPRPGYRFCTRCGEEKALDGFHRHGDRRQAQCPDCRSEVQREDLYGLSEDQYQSMLADQKGLCAVCRRPERRTYRGRVRRLAVDHDHETGEVRRLLCGDCNLLIGLAGDDVDRLMAAVAYLIEEDGKKRAKSLGLTTVLPDDWNS